MDFVFQVWDIITHLILGIDPRDMNYQSQSTDHKTNWELKKSVPGSLTTTCSSAPNPTIHIQAYRSRAGCGNRTVLGARGTPDSTSQCQPMPSHVYWLSKPHSVSQSLRKGMLYLSDTLSLNRFLHVFLCMCMCPCPRDMCCGQRIIGRSQFSPSTISVPVGSGFALSSITSWTSSGSYPIFEMEWTEFTEVGSYYSGKRCHSASGVAVAFLSWRNQPDPILEILAKS